MPSEATHKRTFPLFSYWAMPYFLTESDGVVPIVFIYTFMAFAPQFEKKYFLVCFCVVCAEFQYYVPLQVQSIIVSNNPTTITLGERELMQLTLMIQQLVTYEQTKWTELITNFFYWRASICRCFLNCISPFISNQFQNPNQMIVFKTMINESFQIHCGSLQRGLIEQVWQSKARFLYRSCISSNDGSNKQMVVSN